MHPRRAALPIAPACSASRCLATLIVGLALACESGTSSSGSSAGGAMDAGCKGPACTSGEPVWGCTFVAVDADAGLVALSSWCTCYEIEPRTSLPYAATSCAASDWAPELSPKCCYSSPEISGSNLTTCSCRHEDGDFFRCPGESVELTACADESALPEP